MEKRWETPMVYEFVINAITKNGSEDWLTEEEVVKGFESSIMWDPNFVLEDQYNWQHSMKS